MSPPVNERPLPHNIEAEKAVLGAVLVHNDAMATAAAVVKPGDFFRLAHGVVFDTMIALSSLNAAIDLVTLKDALEKRGELADVGGPAYLAALIDGVPRSMNVEHYAKIVKELAVLRRVIHTATKAQATAYEGQEPPALIIDRTFSELLQLSTEAVGVGLEPVGIGLDETLLTLQALADPTSSAWGHRTGLQSLDRKIRGLRGGKLIVIAGRPGDGKTSLCLNIAAQVARAGETVAFFALEQERAELRVQLVSSEARVNIEDVADDRANQDDYKRIQRTLEDLDTLPLYIDDSTELSPVTLRAKARRLQLERGLSLIVVDYVQLMHGLPTAKRTENEHEKLTAISRSLKLLSKDLNVNIVICCQLNRAPEARHDGRPMLGDLRGSGSLEQDADTVILIHDPSKAPKKGFGRKKKTAQVVEEAVQEGVVELIIAKNRGLSTGSVRVLFRKEITRFENLQL
jgi:replicative DNA helicase